jgi:hypothetical protein
LSDWRLNRNQEKIGTDTVGLYLDPLLTNPGTEIIIGNTDNLNTLTAYQLNSNSPAINKGLNLQTLYGVNMGLNDFFGNVIPNSLFDIGAHEFVEPTFLNERKEQQTVVFPNPAKDVVFIRAEQGSRVSLLSISGVLIDTKRTKEMLTSFNIVDLPSGLYIVCVDSKNKLSKYKIIIE